MGLDRFITLDTLMACWGMATWLGINGLYVQLPLLVQELPEGWALPSAMAVAIAAANVGLLLYALMKRLLPRITDTVYIYILLLIAMLALLLNAFLYSETAVINGQERSVAFISLVFFSGLVGCTSSVLFYPYLRFFRDIYLPTYLVGEGLSAFVPSILSLIQGIGGEPECVLSEDGGSYFPVFPPARFSTMVYILLLAVLATISLVAFTIIERLSSSYFASERVELIPVEKKDEMETLTDQSESLLQPNWIGVMTLMAVMNGLTNGVLPSVQTYSCIPYGTRAHHLAVSLSTMANPLACMAGVFLKPLPSRILGVVLAITLAPLGYILATALMSPTPPLVGTGAGEFLVVFSWIWALFALSYARMWVYGWGRRGGTKGMRAIGTVTQIGSSVAAVALFLIIEYTDAFSQPERCPPVVAM